jgi:hypothetical protein
VVPGSHRRSRLDRHALVIGSRVSAWRKPMAKSAFGQQPEDSYLKVATRFGPASLSSITATVLISIRSAHLAAPKWSAAASFVS